jgi:hypothetical protein
MNFEKTTQEKNIIVFNKGGELLAPCNVKRANKLVKRNCAKWVDNDKIELLVNDRDRKILRKQIIEEAGRICYICNKYIPENEFPTLDHVKPKFILGEDKKENLKCCCKRCNDDKSNKLLNEYVNHIKANRKYYIWISDEQLEIVTKLADIF